MGGNGLPPRREKPEGFIGKMVNASVTTAEAVGTGAEAAAITAKSIAGLLKSVSGLVYEFTLILKGEGALIEKIGSGFNSLSSAIGSKMTKILESNPETDLPIFSDIPPLSTDLAGRLDSSDTENVEEIWNALGRYSVLKSEYEKLKKNKDFLKKFEKYKKLAKSASTLKESQSKRRVMHVGNLKKSTSKARGDTDTLGEPIVINSSTDGAKLDFSASISALGAGGSTQNPSTSDNAALISESIKTNAKLRKTMKKLESLNKDTLFKENMENYALYAAQLKVNAKYLVNRKNDTFDDGKMTFDDISLVFSTNKLPANLKAAYTLH